ncbi:hypothetical protein [Sideroxydans sp.]
MGKNNKIKRVQKKLKTARRLSAHKKRQSEKNSSSLNPAFKMLPNPFAELNDEQRKKIVSELAHNSENKYQESLAKIKELLVSCDPISMLSILASYGLTVGVGDNGIQEKDSERKLQQFHVEICQALALQINPNNFQHQPVTTDNVQEMWTALSELMSASHFRGLEFSEGSSTQEVSIKQIQRMMMGHTQAVRNWGYFSQVKSIAYELYSHFDDLIKNRYGFSCSNVIALFQRLIDDTEHANTIRLQSFKDLYKLKDKTKLAIKYHELIGSTPAAAEQFIETEHFRKMSFKALFFMLMSHHDLRLHESYEFSPKYLADKLEADVTATIGILDIFSYELGALREYETEHLYLSNPIWQRPIIKIENEKYFCALPQMFFSFVLPSLDRLVEEVDSPLLRKMRADYLEEKIVEIINRRFPESNTVSSLKWKLGGVEYETDLITFIDSHAIIVEAKSGKVTDPALRGAPDRLKKHIDELLISPNNQSKRLKERLEELIAHPDIDDDLRKKLPINLCNIHKIIRISVSLESLGTIQANVAQLTETGWLPDTFVPCPTMNLADFETLFDFLEHPVQIIHYLETRQELEGRLEYMGDELDLMGLYIQTLFNMGDLDTDVNLYISEMSAPLDTYYNSRDAGVNIAKPHPLVSPLFSKFMEQLEKRQTPRWTEIGVVLNRFSPDDQRKLSKMIDVLKERVKTNWMLDDHKNMVIYIPPKASQYAICYVMFNNDNAVRRNEFIEKAAMFGLEPEHVKQCLVIAKNIDDDSFAYHFIGLME